MMEAARSWIMSVVAVGMLVSLCLGLSPGGKVQKVGRFCGGLLLFLAVVTPLTRLDLTGSLEEFQNYCDQLSVTSDEFIQASGSVTQDLIVSQSEACIRAQARNLGADVAVTVTCEEQDGISVPSTVATVFVPSNFFSPQPVSIPTAITPVRAATAVLFVIVFISSSIALQF